MKTSSLLSFIFFILFSSFSWAALVDDDNTTSAQTFIQCLKRSSKNSESISQVIYTPNNSSYTSILLARIDNLRYTVTSTPKPLIIVTPTDEAQIQAVVYCARTTRLSLRIRGGGHDFEGQSYRAYEPFIMLDMINLRSVDIDLETETALVGAGATLGELYYRISEKSKTLAFPAGLWSTVGVSGFVGGGGYGMMNRKFGLAADNTLDARLVDVDGKILDRKSMGEDLFWAIRGGGVSSFGIVLSWKIKLVRVPETVTIFRVRRTLEQNGAELFRKWQSIAPNFQTRDLDVRCIADTIQSNLSTRADKKTVMFEYQALFLGTIDTLLPIIKRSFPELGVAREDCTESSWIDSTPFFSNFTIGTPPEILLNRSAIPRNPYKGKSSFVREPISAQGLEGVWNRMLEFPLQSILIQYTPFGGRMNEFSESALPYPHRPGVLYMINIGVTLNNDMAQQLQRINELFNYYAPFVTKNPRTSYVNYLDLDLGQGSKTYAEASVWGRKYFSNNFDRLVKVKGVVDPYNFFKHGQSIPRLM